MHYHKNMAGLLIACLLLVSGYAYTPGASAVAQTQHPDHHIGVRMVDGVGQFYHRQTDEQFTPIGVNYVRIANQMSAGGAIFHNARFNPRIYDTDEVEQALATMQALGYNTARIFLNSCCPEASIGDPEGGLSAAYLDNVADFLERAKAHGIYVIITTNDVAKVGGYTAELATACCHPFEGHNIHYLTETGLRVNQQFWQDVIGALQARQAPLEMVLAYALRNELFFDSHLPPLSLDTGTVTTANGQTYDMHNPAQKQRMMDENLVYWIDEMRAAILEVDPTALVTVGFFWPKTPNPARANDSRVIRTAPALTDSTADFIDLHLYPGLELSLAEYIENFEMAGFEEKPVIMGELGAFQHAYPSAEAAARALLEWQVASCEYGFDGWLLWTWDAEEQTELYHGSSEDGIIGQMLAPANRPTDLCALDDTFVRNIATGKTVQVSRYFEDFVPENAIDGAADTWWSAGAPPVQWIAIDLGGPHTINEIRLLTSQSPAGQTRHRVWGRSPDQGERLLVTFEDHTQDSEWLVHSADPAWENIHMLRVETVTSPSWVGWREIEILGYEE